MEVRRLAAGSLIAAVLASAVLLAVGCGEDRAATPTVDLAQMTVEQAYARMAQAMTREGEVLHTQVRTGSERSSDGEVLPYSTTDLWIDTSAQAVREEFHLDPSVDDYDLAKQYTLIVRDGKVYVPDDPGERAAARRRVVLPGERRRSDRVPAGVRGPPSAAGGPFDRDAIRRR